MFLDKYYKLTQYLTPDQFEDYIYLRGEEYIKEKVGKQTKTVKLKLEKLKNRNNQENPKLTNHNFDPQTVTILEKRRRICKRKSWEAN